MSTEHGIAKLINNCHYTVFMDGQGPAKFVLLYAGHHTSATPYNLVNPNILEKPAASTLKSQAEDEGSRILGVYSIVSQYTIVVIFTNMICHKNPNLI
jgi:hypothetical protein